MASAIRFSLACRSALCSVGRKESNRTLKVVLRGYVQIAIYMYYSVSIPRGNRRPCSRQNTRQSAEVCASSTSEMAFTHSMHSLSVVAEKWSDMEECSCNATARRENLVRRNESTK